MERSRNKIRSPRMKACNVQYAPEGRRGNVYRYVLKYEYFVNYLIENSHHFKCQIKNILSSIENRSYNYNMDFNPLITRFIPWLPT
jgi:hypothetical protein